jgi:hypothetical protein
MKKIIFLVFLFGNVTGVAAQQFAYPDIKQTGKTKTDFIPKDWKILQEANGDLNKDGLADWAMVIQYKDSVEEYTISYARPRILVIVFQNADKKGFIKKLQSNHFILREDEGGMMGDPIQLLEIKKNVLVLDFYGGGGGSRWSAYYKFRFDNTQFLLIGAELADLDLSTGNYLVKSCNFLTMKMKKVTGKDMAENKEKETEIWKKLEIKELKTFDTFIRPFTWEIEKDTYL